MWCVLPATEASGYDKSGIPPSVTSVGDRKTVKEHFLVPLNVAESVLDFESCGQSSLKLVEALRSLGLPELDSDILSTVCLGTRYYTKLESYNLARNLVATLKTPHSLLTALHQKLKADPSSLGGNLECNEAMEVLEYISRSTKALLYEDKETLRMLPFFPLVGGRLGKLQD